MPTRESQVNEVLSLRAGAGAGAGMGTGAGMGAGAGAGAGAGTGAGEGTNAGAGRWAHGRLVRSMGVHITTESSECVAKQYAVDGWARAYLHPPCMNAWMGWSMDGRVDGRMESATEGGMEG